jgi:CRP-like cAMP-binding protein
MQVKADVRVLQQIPLFEDSDAGHLQLLSFASKRVELEKGSILFQKGTTGAAAYLVLEGTAEVYDTTEASGDVVATAESGALLGELSMIANVAYGVTVKTAIAFAAQRIDRELFLRVAGEFPEFGAGILRKLASRLGLSVEAIAMVKPLFQA